MALTEFQRRVCRLIAKNRIDQGESYVAGGVALNTLTGASRVSRDIDLFHDTPTALQATWTADRTRLEAEGLSVQVIRERPSFVEARVWRGQDDVLMQWAQDSAFRFFPLVSHEELGLTLHPFDLATNKVLALVGRLEVRDWIDVITCHDRIQPLGYLAWASSGKDPGFGPASILEQAGRSTRYSDDEVRSLSFEGAPPDAAALSRAWHTMLREARDILDRLPSDKVGTCVLAESGDLFRGGTAELAEALSGGRIRFHPGRIKGAYPALVRS
jgi:hypothetical protein